MSKIKLFPKGCIITKKWESSPDKELKSVFGTEFITKEGELFEYLIKTFHFNEIIEDIINKEPNYIGEERYIDHLKNSIKDSTPKITIKIELEKYE